jgi:hypothetical protein
MHAEKLRLLSDPSLPHEKVHMLVMKLISRSPNVAITIGEKVKRLLGREYKRVYSKWLKQHGKDQKIPQPRLHDLQKKFNRATLEERRRLANQARMEDGFDTVPWRDPPRTRNLTTTSSTAVISKPPASGPLRTKTGKGTPLKDWLNGNKRPRALTTMKQMWLS